jgi:hypothetical protein
MRIPLKRKSDGEIVGDVTFGSGGEITAAGVVKKNGDGTTRDVKIIRDAVLKFGSLTRVVVYTEKGHVQVWRGFWGWIAGLRFVLPSVGYEIAVDAIEWPT